MLSVRIRGFHLFSKPELDFQQLKGNGVVNGKLYSFLIPRMLVAGNFIPQEESDF